MRERELKLPLDLLSHSLSLPLSLKIRVLPYTDVNMYVNMSIKNRVASYRMIIFDEVLVLQMNLC